MSFFCVAGARCCRRHVQFSATRRSKDLRGQHQAGALPHHCTSLRSLRAISKPASTLGVICSSHGPVQYSDGRSLRNDDASLPTSAQHMSGLNTAMRLGSVCRSQARGVLPERGNRERMPVHERWFKTRQRARSLTGVIRMSHASHGLRCAHAACAGSLPSEETRTLGWSHPVDQQSRFGHS